ncbi:MAG: SDR family oxidoreductase [Actinobacteria bacterium]|jgi:NAD(P)-dependent dehydrogenase (short-subunit alcohol dehydrogenase family)|nr:SDR family oxidoreductase [Actinomycetota bacterium]
MSNRPVALVSDTRYYVGPDLARRFAEKGFDLVLGDPSPNLVSELESMGARIVPVTGHSDLSSPESAQAQADAALATFGRLDSAVMFSGQIVTGRFVNSTIDQLRQVFVGCVEAPYNFMRAVVPVMTEREAGQILIITSASGARPTPGAPLYSSVRAAATMLVKNVADEVARTGVQVNAVGTNFMDFPAFLKASGANDPEVRAKIESQVPMRRLGTMEEFSAFCMAFLDGSSRFTTGQFVAYAGGWA